MISQWKKLLRPNVGTVRSVRSYLLSVGREGRVRLYRLERRGE